MDQLDASPATQDGGDDTAVIGLIAALDDSDWRVRQRTANLLKAYGPKAASALPRLRVALGADDDYDVRESVISAIAVIETDEGARIADLERAIQDDWPNVRAEAARNLALLSGHRDRAIDILVHALGRHDAWQAPVREAMVSALCALGTPQELIQRADELLQTRDEARVRAGIAILVYSHLPEIDSAAQVEAARTALQTFSVPQELYELAGALIARVDWAVLERLALDERQISSLARSALLLANPTTAFVADLAARRPRDVIDLVASRFPGADPDTYTRAIHCLADNALLEQLAPEERRLLTEVTVEVARGGYGLELFRALGEPAELLRKVLESSLPAPDPNLVSTLLGPQSDLLREYWSSIRDLAPDLFTVGLTHPLWSTNGDAAELIRANARDLARSDSRGVLERGLEEILARVPQNEIRHLAQLALTELRQVARSTSLEKLVPTLREGDDSAKIEVANGILQDPTPEAARVLVRELASWIAYGEAQVVELTAEAIRPKAEMVLPLLDQWERGLELDDYGRARLLDVIVPRDLRPAVDRLLQGEKVSGPQLAEIREWLIEAPPLEPPSRVQESKRVLSQETLDALEERVAKECDARALRVRQRLARLLADMSDERFFDDSERKVFDEITGQLQRHAVRILGRRLATEQDITTRESIARTLANVGGREAVDVITRALVDDERTKANRQDLLARYYLEPSKTRSDEVADILHGAVAEAKRTLRLLQFLNGLFFLTALTLVVVGTVLLFTGDTAAEILGGGVAGISGLVGLVIQILREPLVRIQNAVTRLVQVETAFASFIWELNLNGTYIQSQYVADGRLEDEQIRHTVARIENAMHLAMDLVARYAEDGDGQRIPRLTSVFPATPATGDSVVLRGSFLKPPSSNGGGSRVLAVDRTAISPSNLVWEDDLIEFTWPDEDRFNGGVVWVNAVIDGTETNALPVQVVRPANGRRRS